MFQNVADIPNQNEEVIEKNNKIYYRLKEIFKYQNIIIYILTFLMSTLSIKGELMPFGLAIMAACVGESVPIAFVFVSAILGTCIGGGTAGLINFLEISVVYFILVLIFRAKVAVEERNEFVKTGGKLFTACFIVSLVKNFVGVFLLYDVFMGAISSAIVYVFYKIFVNGLASIKDLNIKKAFTIEELIATVIIISLASSAFNDVSIFSLNISNIIIIFMIMVLGWKNGMLLGGCFVSYKSEKTLEEMEEGEYAISLLGGVVEHQTEFYLPDSDIYRNLVTIRKQKNTPEKYPRKAGLPLKKPLSK